MIIGLQTNENVPWQANENANEMCPGKLMKMLMKWPCKLMRMVRSFYDNTLITALVDQ